MRVLILIFLLFFVISAGIIKAKAENYQNYFQNAIIPYIKTEWKNMLRDDDGYATQDIKEINLKRVVAMDCPHQHRIYHIEVIYHLKYFFGKELKEENDLRQYVAIWIEDGKIMDGKVVMWEVIY